MLQNILDRSVANRLLVPETGACTIKHHGTLKIRRITAKNEHRHISRKEPSVDVDFDVGFQH